MGLFVHFLDDDEAGPLRHRLDDLDESLGVPAPCPLVDGVDGVRVCAGARKRPSRHAHFHEYREQGRHCGYAVGLQGICKFFLRKDAKAKTPCADDAMAVDAF